jgi:TonB-dependent receptor
MANAVNGTSGRLMAPSGWDYRQMDEHQQRLASNLVLQWRPNDKLEITLNGLNSFAYRKYANHYVSQNIGYGQVTAGKVVNGTWMGSESSLNDFDTEAGTGHNRNSDFSLNVKFNPTEALEITADVQFVESSSPFRSNVLYTSMLSSPRYTIDVSGSEPVIGFQNLASTADNGNYIWSAAMDHQSYDVGHSANARIDATYKFQGGGLFGLFKGVDAGFRTEQKHAVARADGWNWGALTPAWYWDIFQSWAKLDGSIGCSSGVNCSLAAADGNTYTTATGNLAKVNSYAELFKYGGILGNNVPSLWVPSVALTGMNTVQSSNLLAAVEHADVPANNDFRTDQNYRRWISYAAIAGCTGDDATCLAAYQNAVGGNSSGNRNSTTNEQTYAGYMQLVYGLDSFLGYDIPIDGNIGVRIVRTEDEVGSGKLVMPYLNSIHHCTIGEIAGDGIAVTDCTDYNLALAFLGGSGGEGATVARPAVGNGYTDILPSFNFRARLTDKVQTRLAYSETIVRPSFSDMNASASLNFNWDDSQTHRLGIWTADPSGSGGNPYLKPMRARNYDASLEWYFAPTGALTLSVFHKDLSNYFHSATIRESFTHPITGQTMDFNYTTYINTAKGKIEGFELSYTQFYDQLPGFLGGFGIQANYTKIYNSGGVNGAGDVGNVTSTANAQSARLPIEGISNDSYNLALMYAKYNIDARLAWNWRSHYLSSTSDAATKLPVWVENYGQLDGSVFYSFWDNYKLGFQVTNITGSEYYGDTGFADYHPRTVTVQADRKLSIVFRTLF